MAAIRQEPGPRHEPETMVTLELGTSVVITGHLAASENLTIHGPFEGTIEVLAHTVTIGRHAQIEARIVAQCVVIEGKVQGHVTATDKIEIRATAQLHGDIVATIHAQIEARIVAQCVVIEGKVQGHVTATDKIEIRATAQLHGDIVAPRIVLADGAWVCGTVETRTADSARLQVSDSLPVTTVKGPRGQKSPVA